jgi:general secretion pathway protein B
VQPARRRSEPVAAATPAAPPPADTKPRRAPAPAPAAARDPAPEAVYLPAPTPPAPPPTRAPDPIQEENLRTLQQLPEAIQREVPKVAVGGYIYSPNPADRLLLVDKMLRREGEELAPGLVLERLMPKYAVMNYRGTRYRVAY